MQLDLGPTPLQPERPSPTDLTPTPVQEPLPEPGGAYAALKTALAEQQPDLSGRLSDDQERVLIAAGALSKAGQTLAPEAADQYAARVLEASGSPSTDVRQDVEAARVLLRTAGTSEVAAGLGENLDGLVLAQETRREPAPAVGGLTREQVADFGFIPEQRQDELKEQAEGYVEAYAGDDQRGGVPRIDFVDLKDVLTDLKGRADLTDVEKAFVWSEIANGKGQAGNLEFYDERLAIDNRGVRSELVDSWRAWNTPAHLVATFRDGYHGFGSPDGDPPGMGHQSEAEARQTIWEKEDGPFGLRSRLAGANPGDAAASQALVAAFHAYRDAPEGQRFDAFADIWTERVIAPQFR